MYEEYRFEKSRPLAVPCESQVCFKGNSLIEKCEVFDRIYAIFYHCEYTVLLYKLLTFNIYVTRAPKASKAGPQRLHFPLHSMGTY